MTDVKQKVLIGRVEKVNFLDFADLTLHARIDTGAKTSAVWATDIHESDRILSFRLAWEKNGQSKIHQTKVYSQRLVANSTGHVEERYAVRLRVKLAGRQVKATFTLANRASQVYPVLVGRNLLRGKFLVDVSQGKPLPSKERAREATKHAALEGKESRK
jgi:hypothetical protein